jgi:sn-glycerol 3-phosphate transport system ATP-binding protein
MRREIRALQQSLGITMVYVTHDQTEAMSMADRVVLLNGGKIEQNDTPDMLYANPVSEFSARFIGTPPMNLLALDPRTQHISGCGGTALTGLPNGAVKLGLRPEHIAINADGNVDALVETVEYFGADSIVICKVGQNTGVAVRTGGHVRANPGERIKLLWNLRRQHFFDASGKALPRTPSIS